MSHAFRHASDSACQPGLSGFGIGMRWSWSRDQLGYVSFFVRWLSNTSSVGVVFHQAASAWPRSLSGEVKGIQPDPAEGRCVQRAATRLDVVL